jgi:hypothetical protein
MLLTGQKLRGCLIGITGINIVLRGETRPRMNKQEDKSRAYGGSVFWDCSLCKSCLSASDMFESRANKCICFGESR